MGPRDDGQRPGAAPSIMDDRKTGDDPGRTITLRQLTEAKKSSNDLAVASTTASPSSSALSSPACASRPEFPPLPPPSPSKDGCEPPKEQPQSSPPPQPSQPSQPLPDASADLTTKVFRWFSTATPESLGAVGVGLAATTYFVLGRVGLVLIGAFSGVAFFVAWEARNPDVTRAIQGEAGKEAIVRIFEYRAREQQQQQQQQKQTGDGTAKTGIDEEQALSHVFDTFQPETRAALTEFTDAVVNDYVKWWYDPIVPTDTTFPLSCRRVLTSFLVTISNHLSRKRPADAFLDFLTNSSSIIIVIFSELATAYAAMPQQQQQQTQTAEIAATTIAAADAVYNYLASNPESSLANLLNQRQQARKLRMVADDILGFLDKQTYEFPPAHTFLREIAATSVLETTLQTCSKPEWINGWIVYLLEGGEPDFNQAIDVGMQTRADINSKENKDNKDGKDGKDSKDKESKESRGSTTNDNAIRAAAAASTANATAYFDIDGNVGNMPLAKASRRKESVVHRKQLSRAEEEMEEAMEEMKRMNDMIAEENARRSRESKRFSTEGRSSSETQPKEKEPEKEKEKEKTPAAAVADRASSDTGLPSPAASARVSGDEGTQTVPVTPLSTGKEEATSTAAQDDGQFTKFEQLVPPAKEEEETSDTESKKPALAPLTLHNATVTIHDEPMADKGRLKSKPTWDFLVQIEPANSHYPGWMIVRKYGDFEKVHEVMRRIAMIAGCTAFTEQHSQLPNWKQHTRGSLRGELERYVRDACWYQPLAESEGMKRFLEKDTNNMPANSGGKMGFQAFETMGKNMLDVLTSAPKGVAEGGKGIVGGVTGVLGSIGGLGRSNSTKKHASSASSISLAGLVNLGATTTAATLSSSSSSSGGGGSGNQAATPTSSVLQDVTAYTNRLSISTSPRVAEGSGGASSWRSRDSLDSQRSSVVSTQPGRPQPMDRRMSYQSQSGEGTPGRSRSADLWAEQQQQQLHHPTSSSNWGSRPSSVAGGGHFPRSPSTVSLSGTRLQAFGVEDAFAAGAALGAAGADDFSMGTGPSPSPMASPVRWSTAPPTLPGQPGQSSQPTTPSGQPVPPSSAVAADQPPPWKPAPAPTSYTKQYAGISENETRVAVELMFAVINELYTLSSAWNIRRTLLAAAKSFLLRPGNPSLTSIQNLLQTSLLDSITSDAGLASQLRRVRENALPTEAERAAWPAEMSAEEKEKLRVKARRLLIQSGVPAALMGVMGQSATADALGRFFDCLQIEEVARGLLFGVLLQTARIITH